MDISVTCTYLFSEDDYHRYVQLRDAPRLRRASVTLVLLGAVFFVAGIMIATFDEPSFNAVVVAALGIVCVACGAHVLRTGKTVGGPRAHAGDARAFLHRHGAVGAPAAFQMAVQVRDDGIELAWGAPGAHQQQTHREFYPWSEWRRVVLDRDAIFVERDTHQGGISNIFGFNYLLRMAERDRFDDAYLPLRSIGDVDARGLTSAIGERIASVR